MAVGWEAVPSEILAGILAYHQPGDFIEVRCPNAGKYKTTISGYFDDFEAAAREIAKLSNYGNENGNGKIPAVYFTLNKIKSDLAARYYNRFEYKAKETTSDKDVLSLEWLPVDVDAVRPAGISSTDEEHQAAIDKAREIRAWLISQGWPENAFIRADSGNGGHLTAKICLENKRENTELIKKCLEALDKQFSDEHCKVDLTTHNPSRIWKVPGTAVLKGDDTSTRPHRMAKLLERPELLETVPTEKLKALADTLPKADTASKKGGWQDNMSKASASSFDPKQYAESHGAAVIRTDTWTDPEGGKWELAILAECPFDPSHNRGEARVGVRSDGKRTFRCFHDSCQGKDWHALRDLWEPDRKERRERSGLEEALLFMADRCDGAHSIDGQGFNKHDSLFGKSMAAKVRSGQRLTYQEYKDVYKMLKTYNKNQLAPAGMDIRLIPKEPPKDEDAQQEQEIIPPSPEAIESAREILENGKPIEAHLNYVNGKIHGGEKPARAAILAGYSAYLPPEDRLHADAVGSAQSGKSATITAVLETFPEENVIVTSEASPKSLYYLAQESPERLKDTIVYIDDARPEHIPVLKTFRNEGNVTPRNLTVSDGEVLELIVQYRPVVLASSVTPLRDMEQQATSRTFLISIPDATPAEEAKVRAAIRRKARAGAILSQKTDEQLKVLRVMACILRDEGIREVLVPFDAIEPAGADRRGAGQFQRLIKISAFVNQFQRPLLELTDGRKFVLAIYEDLETAAKVWFDFAEGQEFKIPARALEVLHVLPSAWPGKTAPTLAKEMGKGQRTIERYLEDLYESGVVGRERISAPGMPWGYWCEDAMRQRAVSQISDAGYDKPNSDRITTKNLCRKYLGEKSSDSLKDSYISFFSNNDIIRKEMYKGIKVKGDLSQENPGKIYSSLFSPKSCRDSEKESDDSDYSRQDGMSQFGEKLIDSESEDVANTPENVAIPSEAKPKTIEADLHWAEEQRRAAEEHAREMAAKYTNRKNPDEPEELSPSEKIRIAARLEYGYNGSVDPVKVASSIKVPVDVIKEWLEANYDRLDRPDGVVRYTQRRAKA